MLSIEVDGLKRPPEDRMHIPLVRVLRIARLWLTGSCWRPSHPPPCHTAVHHNVRSPLRAEGLGQTTVDGLSSTLYCNFYSTSHKPAMSHMPAPSGFLMCIMHSNRDKWYLRVTQTRSSVLVSRTCQKLGVTCSPLFVQAGSAE